MAEQNVAEEELITRSAAIEALGEKPEPLDYDEFSHGMLTQWNFDVEALEKMPATISKRITARWVKVPGYCTPGGDPVWACSRCGKGMHVYGIEHSSYGKDIADSQWVACPNCGAVMTGDGVPVRNATESAPASQGKDALNMQTVLNSLPKEKEVLAGQSWETYYKRQGYNQCLKDAMKAITKAYDDGTVQETAPRIRSEKGYMCCGVCGSRLSAVKAHFCSHCGVRLMDA